MDLSSKILEGLHRLIDQRTRRVDYCALYSCTVVAQRADGTLDLAPETATMPAPQAVPIRYGVPGVRATVPAGTRVLLGFEGADPGRPVATLWELGDGVVLHLNGGTERAARQGHAVHASGTPVPHVGMAGWMAAVTATLNGLVPTSVPAPPTELGTIAEGSDALRIP